MYDHILIPVAPDHPGEYARASSTAQKLLAPKGRVSVLSVLEEIPAYVDTYVPPGQMEKNMAEVSEKLKAEFKGDHVTTHVISGRSANAILDWAEGHGVDCIVVMSHRPGFSDYFIGSTAARVVRHAKCSVVVLR